MPLKNAFQQKNSFRFCVPSLNQKQPTSGAGAIFKVGSRRQEKPMHDFKFQPLAADSNQGILKWYPYLVDQIMQIYLGNL